MVLDGRSILGRSRSINVGRPPFNLEGPLHPLLVSFVGKFPNLPTEEPTEDHGHGESNHDDSDDDGEGDVEDDEGGDAADGRGVDEADSDDVHHTLGELLLVRRDHEGGDVAGAVGRVSVLNLVEEGRVGDLTDVEPLKKAEIEDVPVLGRKRVWVRFSPNN